MMLIGQIMGIVTKQINGVDGKADDPAEGDGISFPSRTRKYIQETPARSHGTELR